MHACMHASMRLQETRRGFELRRIEAGVAVASWAVAHVAATPLLDGAKPEWGEAVEEPIAWRIGHGPMPVLAWRGD